MKHPQKVAHVFIILPLKSNALGALASRVRGWEDFSSFSGGLGVADRHRGGTLLTRRTSRPSSTRWRAPSAHCTLRPDVPEGDRGRVPTGQDKMQLHGENEGKQVVNPSEGNDPVPGFFKTRLSSGPQGGTCWVDSSWRYLLQGPPKQIKHDREVMNIPKSKIVTCSGHQHRGDFLLGDGAFWE